MVQIERLVGNVESSVRILQRLLHRKYFDADGTPKDLPPVPPEGTSYLEDLGQIIFALNRISMNRPRQETHFLAIEPAFTKLQFELLSLALCPVDTVLFRCLISVVPFTVARIKTLMDNANNEVDPSFFIRWINNSVMHRDYMSTLKELGMGDENGAKGSLSETTKDFRVIETLPIRPKSADGAIKRHKRV
jgi:hypothetical protein